MNLPFVKGCADNLSIGLIDHYLRLQRVPLLFATVVSSLFFLGVQLGFQSHRPQRHSKCQHSDIAAFCQAGEIYQIASTGFQPWQSDDTQQIR